MGSEMQSIGGGSLVAGLRRKLAERAEWERLHPDLAAAWSEALEEDHRLMVQRERAFAEERARERIPDLLRALEIPLDAIDALGRLTEGEHVAAARKFMAATAEEKRFLLLLGTVGTGKTVAAAWALGEAIARHRRKGAWTPAEMKRTPAMFVRAGTFSRLSAYGREDRQWFDEMLRCGVLVLDDLAAESLSQVGAAMLDELLDTRYGARLRTIITSNLAKEAFLLRVGERAADRMRHFAILSQSSGKSLRQKVKP